jgi:hypothetical protein
MECLQVDFSMNHIGSAGAQLLLPVLEEKQNIKAFRMTNRIDRDTARAFHSLMMQRNVKSKKKKVVKRKKKTATSGGETVEGVEVSGAEEEVDPNAAADAAAEDAAAVATLLGDVAT